MMQQLMNNPQMAQQAQAMMQNPQMQQHMQAKNRNLSHIHN